MRTKVFDLSREGRTTGAEGDVLLMATLLGEAERLALHVGIDRAPSTLRSLRVVIRHVGHFLLATKGRTDIAMHELKPDFIEQFANYLRLECRLAPTTVWAYTVPLKRVVAHAHQDGLIAANPFARFHLTPHCKHRVFLTVNELQLLQRLSLAEPELAFVRDMFLFASFTGLSFIDLFHLKRSQVVRLHGRTWIVSHRQKTHTPFQVCLLHTPLRILEQWRSASLQPDDRLFPLYGYKRMSRKLRKVVRLSGIGKQVTWHTARHTFATLALNHGMPIESVSRSLGHTKISTTQIYARLSLEKLGQDFDALGQNLSFNEK